MGLAPVQWDMNYREHKEYINHRVYYGGRARGERERWKNRAGQRVREKN